MVLGAEAGMEGSALQGYNGTAKQPEEAGPQDLCPPPVWVCGLCQIRRASLSGDSQRVLDLSLLLSRLATRTTRNNPERPVTTGRRQLLVA